MTTDRTTKVLLALIAMGLFLNGYCSVRTACRGAGPSARNYRCAEPPDISRDRSDS